MSVVLVKSLSKSFVAGAGLVIDGKGGFPSIYFDFENVMLYITDFVYTYREFGDANYPENLGNKLKSLDGHVDKRGLGWAGDSGKPTRHASEETQNSTGYR